MTRLRKKIGQMLIMGFSGFEADEHSKIAQWLRQDGLGGVLLFDYDLPRNCFGKNLKDRTQIKRLTQQLNHLNQDNDQPLFIAIDYEGGAVDRLSSIEGCMSTLRPCDMAELSDEALTQEAEKMAVTIKELGFNLNFAPLVDVNLTESHGIIGKLGRSFSDNPHEITRIAQQFVHVFNQHGITCAYKHFPGHGSAVGDTHQDFVDVSSSFNPIELEPYAELLKDTQASAMVMTAHVINRNLDGSGLPATLSHPILTGLLRHKLGFKGVIVSDDLQMLAIAKHYSLDEALRLTINAGADMMIFANQLGSISPVEVIDRIEQLVHSGAIHQATIDSAYERIVRLKETQRAFV